MKHKKCTLSFFPFYRMKLSSFNGVFDIPFFGDSYVEWSVCGIGKRKIEDGSVISRRWTMAFILWINLVYADWKSIVFIFLVNSSIIIGAP